MKIERTKAFKKDFKVLSGKTQKKFKNKVKLFMTDISHPSLRVKK